MEAENPNSTYSSYSCGDKYITWSPDVILGRGAFGKVYIGKLNETVKVAVKTISMDDARCAEIVQREYEQMKNLHHPNLVSVLHFFKDEKFYRYLVIMELCHAINLDRYVKEKVKADKDNPINIKMPHYVEVMRQIADALNFLHNNNLVHRDIKPKNILLSLNDDPVNLKIGDFGETKPLTNEMRYQLSKYVGTAIYHAPEMIKVHGKIENWDEGKDEDFLRRNEHTFGKEVDVFACGCTFYFFLRDGAHPFGRSATTNSNIEKADEVMMSKEDPDRYIAVEIALEMIAHDPCQRISLPDVLCRLSKHSTFMIDLAWNESSLQGTTGSMVEFTKFGGIEIAVKRFTTDDDRLNQLIDNDTLKNLKHPGLISIIEIFDRPQFKYVGMERCHGSLQDYFNGRHKGSVLPKVNVALKQLTEGLEFIHSKNYVHGELRPCNILIHINEDGARLKLAEFGISRFDASVESRRRYYAPELLRNEEEDGLEKPDAKCDVFSMGCIFYGYATRGGHPFRDVDGSVNVLNNIENVNVNDVSEPWLKQLIKDMIKQNPGDRIDSNEVLEKININY